MWGAAGRVLGMAVVAAVCAHLGGAHTTPPPPRAQPQPHLILIVADDLGWNDVSWHNPEVRTPHLEQLAREGVVLQQSYVLPVCTPTRSALLTGRYPFTLGRQHGVLWPPEPTGLDLRVQLLPEALRQVGYSTHAVGKWHLGFCSWDYTPTRRGFDTFYGYYTGSEDYYEHCRTHRFSPQLGDLPRDPSDGEEDLTRLTDTGDSDDGNQRHQLQGGQSSTLSSGAVENNDIRSILNNMEELPRKENKAVIRKNKRKNYNKKLRKNKNDRKRRLHRRKNRQKRSEHVVMQQQQKQHNIKNKGDASEPVSQAPDSSDFCWLDLRNNTTPDPGKSGMYSSHLFAARVEEVLRGRDPAHPLFLYLPFQNVHAPLQVPYNYTRPYAHIHDRHRRTYLGMVSALDEAVGRVVAALKETNHYQHSVIVFTTDNGGPTMWGGNNWPLRGNKTTLWEGGTRGVALVHSPLLARPGTVSNQLVHATDWFPTLAGLAGGRVGAQVDGVDQWAALSGNALPPRHAFVYNIDNTTNFAAAFRLGDYKVIVGNPGPGEWTPPPQLLPSGGGEAVHSSLPPQLLPSGGGEAVHSSLPTPLLPSGGGEAVHSSTPVAHPSALEPELPLGDLQHPPAAPQARTKDRKLTSATAFSGSSVVSAAIQPDDVHTLQHLRPQQSKSTQLPHSTHLHHSTQLPSTTQLPHSTHLVGATHLPELTHLPGLLSHLTQMNTPIEDAQISETSLVSDDATATPTRPMQVQDDTGTSPTTIQEHRDDTATPDTEETDAGRRTDGGQRENKDLPAYGWSMGGRVARLLADMGAHNSTEIRLYNLHNDPQERHNLAVAQVEVLTRLLEHLVKELPRLVPADIKPDDPAANPKHFGGVWSPGWC